LKKAERKGNMMIFSKMFSDKNLQNILEAINMGRIKEAEKMLDSYLKTHHQNIETAALKNQILQAKSGYESKKSILESLIMTNPSSDDLKIELAFLNQLYCRFSEAISICNQLIGHTNLNANSTTAMALVIKSECLYEMGNFTEAEKQVDITLNLFPNNFEALTLRARIYNRNGNYCTSRQILLPIINKINYPKTAGYAYYVLAQANFKLDYLPEFKNALDESITRGNDLGIIWFYVTSVKP
jgi:tetratricopeptide (TPR) repeat protein